jgi:hypothetical protein
MKKLTGLLTLTFGLLTARDVLLPEFLQAQKNRVRVVLEGTDTVQVVVSGLKQSGDSLGGSFTVTGASGETKYTGAFSANAKVLPTAVRYSFKIPGTPDSVAGDTGIATVGLPTAPKTAGAFLLRRDQPQKYTLEFAPAPADSSRQAGLIEQLNPFMPAVGAVLALLLLAGVVVIIMRLGDIARQMGETRDLLSEAMTLRQPTRGVADGAQPRDRFAELNGTVVEQGNRQAKLLAEMRQELGGLRADIAGLPAGVARELAGVMAGVEQSRDAKQRNAAVVGARKALDDLYGRFSVVAAAEKTAVLLARLRLTDAERADLEVRYRSYTTLNQRYNESVRLVDEAGRAPVEAWANWGSRIDKALADLKEDARRLSEDHKPALFCVLLDKAFPANLHSERRELMGILRVEEDRPAAGTIVEDDSKFDLVAPPKGEGWYGRIVRVELAGYRMVDTGAVLRKPRVLIELTTAKG